MRDSCSSLKNILRFKLSSLQARLTRKQRIKLLMQILALGCPALAHHRFSLYLPFRGRGGAGPAPRRFKALRRLSFHPPGGPSFLEEPAANSGNGACSEGPPEAGVHQPLLRAELPVLRPHQEAPRCHCPMPRQPVKNKKPVSRKERWEGAKAAVTKQAQC